MYTPFDLPLLLRIPHFFPLTNLFLHYSLFRESRARQDGRLHEMAQAATDWQKGRAQGSRGVPRLKRLERRPGKGEEEVEFREAEEERSRRRRAAAGSNRRRRCCSTVAAAGEVIPLRGGGGGRYQGSGGEGGRPGPENLQRLPGMIVLTSSFNPLIVMQ
jgi:hypothetical protein